MGVLGMWESENKSVWTKQKWNVEKPNKLINFNK